MVKMLIFLCQQQYVIISSECSAMNLTEVRDKHVVQF